VTLRVPEAYYSIVEKCVREPARKGEGEEVKEKSESTEGISRTENQLENKGQ
jgi:hypothetical protein